MAQRPNAFAWLGCGCLLFLILAAGGVAVASAIAWMAVTGFASGLARDAVSPEAHRERAISILRPRELPAGFAPVASLRIPWVLRAAALTDGAEGLFLYLEGSSFLDQDGSTDTEGWFERLDLARRAGLSIELGDVLSEHRVTLGPLVMDHRGYRGTVDWNGRERSSLIGVMKLDCRDDERARFAWWIAPGRPDQPTVSTPADATQAAELLKHFDFCG